VGLPAFFALDRQVFDFDQTDALIYYGRNLHRMTLDFWGAILMQKSEQ